MPIKPHIEVDGLRELQADFKRASGGKLPKALGEANKDIGRVVIGRLPEGEPQAVGAGRGAAPRPSATKREVVILVGSAAREARAEARAEPRPSAMTHRNSVAAQQWGAEEVQPYMAGRPYIVGAIQEHQDEIVQTFRDEYTKALAPSFADAE